MTQETFERELARRADAVHGAPLSFDDVRGKARSIRRRRRAAVTGGVAAAVALAVLVPSLLSGPDRPGSEHLEPAAPASGHGAVLHDGTLTLADGSTVPVDVDNADASQVVVLADGRVLVPTNQPNRLHVFTADGEPAGHQPIGTTLVRTSPDNEAAAWMEGDGTIQVLASGSADPVELGTVPTGGEQYPLVDAVIDAEHVLVGDGSTTTTEVTPDGVRPLATSEPLRVTDVSPDGHLWAVQYADDADPQFGCSGLYDPTAATMVARSCETSNLQFAPDGQHLLGMRGDNNMSGSADVFDLDLERVGSFSPDPAVVSRATWADSGHLLVATTDWHDNTWTLVRVGLDGTGPEVLDGPGTGRNPEIVAEYLLSE